MKGKIENPVECRAELEIIDFNLNVYELSQYLELPIIKERSLNDYSFVSGEGVIVKNDKQSSINRWCYQTKQKTIEANDALTELRLVFENRLSKLLEIKKASSTLKICIYIVIYNTQKKIPPLYIDSSNILFASNIESSIDFDIY